MLERFLDVLQVKGENLCDDAFMSKALLPNVCDKDITEPNCLMTYLKNDNAPNNIVHDDVSAGETLIINPNVHNKDEKLPDARQILETYIRTAGKFVLIMLL